MLSLSRTGVLLAACCLILGGCSGGERSDRVIWLGIDGLDPATLDRLMSEGKLPHFAKLRTEGAYAPLISQKPLLSPVIWTTIATGTTPDRHRIGHFVAINEQTGEQLPVTSQMRRMKAIWNIASEAGKRVASVGWWATWPAETVHGSIVSDHLCYHFLFDDVYGGGPAEALGKTYPPELLAEVTDLVRRPQELTPEDVAPFVDVSAEEFARPFSFEAPLGHFKWALATAETHREVGLRLWETERPDLLLVYIEGVDSTSHLFGHLHRTEGLAGELAGQQRRFGRAVEAMYLYADRVVGDYMEAMDSNTTLMVLSDHGFELGQLFDDPSRTRDMRRVSERYHRIEGVLYMYGTHVEADTRLDHPSILDLTPTTLALLGLAPSEDMPGRVLVEGLDLEEPTRVATYETPGGGTHAPVSADANVDPEILEKLKSLGYLSTTSPGGDRNLAAVLFEQGRFEEAVRAYQEQVEHRPDDGALRASLAGALGALGRLDEAVGQLDRAIELDPLSPEAYHNRAVIHEMRGDIQAAIRDYGTALRFSAGYEPAQRALTRLKGNARLQGPATAAEREAYEFAQRASQASRRGDYDEAMRLLDEAERLAPRYPLVFQYRSNVAYIKGDRESAIAALERGLEIDPDNVLFQENLRRLEHARPD